MNWERWVESFVPVEIRLVIAARIPKNSAMKAFLFCVFLFFWFVVLSRREQGKARFLRTGLLLLLFPLFAYRHECRVGSVTQQCQHAQSTDNFVTSDDSSYVGPTSNRNRRNELSVDEVITPLNLVRIQHSIAHIFPPSFSISSKAGSNKVKHSFPWDTLGETSSLNRK